MPKLKQTPSYRLHKPSGQAVVRIDGHDHYLGAHNTEQSRERYNRLVAEWFARGQKPAITVFADGRLSVGQLTLKYLAYAEKYYRKPDGSLTSEVHAVKAAVRPLNKLYRHLPADEFGPLKLTLVRDEMIRRGWVRTAINRHIHRLRRIFKWGVSQELLPATVHQALLTVNGLRAGRTEAPEPEPVQPVPEPQIEAVLAEVSATVGAMIRLQRVTGMRPAEVCMMRGCDLEMKEKVWVYRPRTHKTEYRGHQRVVYLGPRAQEIIRPFLNRDLRAPLFSPEEALTERYADAKDRSKRVKSPQRTPGTEYEVAAYRRAIQRGCDRAFPLPDSLKPKEKALKEWVHRWTYEHGKKPKLSDLPEDLREIRLAVEAFRAQHRWHPHQLRHNRATELRAIYGIEASRVVLGHRSVAVTELYAEVDHEKAEKIMSMVG